MGICGGHGQRRGADGRGAGRCDAVPAARTAPKSVLPSPSAAAGVVGGSQPSERFARRLSARACARRDLAARDAVKANVWVPVLVRRVEPLDRRMDQLPRPFILDRSHDLDALRVGVGVGIELRRFVRSEHVVRFEEVTSRHRAATVNGKSITRPDGRSKPLRVGEGVAVRYSQVRTRPQPD